MVCLVCGWFHILAIFRSNRSFINCDLRLSLHVLSYGTEGLKVTVVFHALRLPFYSMGHLCFTSLTLVLLIFLHVTRDTGCADTRLKFPTLCRSVAINLEALALPTEP